MEASVNLVMQKTADSCYQIARNLSIEIDKNLLGERMKQSFKEWYPKIITEAKQDAEAADLMDNLKRGKIDPLVKSAFSVALLHGCVNYAKYLLQVDTCPVS